MIGIAINHGIKKVWSLKKIYATVLVHLYDQATDIAVIIQWGIMVKQEANGKDFPSVNMLSFFIPGVIVVLLYRIITLIYSLHWNNTHLQSLSTHIWDAFLSIFDLYFIKIVYQEIKIGHKEPNKTHRSLQLSESLFERFVLSSVPFCFLRSSQSILLTTMV